MSLPSVGSMRAGKLRRFLGEPFHQGLANVEARKVDINELTIGRMHICWGSSVISWACLSARVWLI
jgi:hypothetical protein